MSVALLDGDVLCYNACENRYKDKSGNTIVTLGDEIIDPVADERYIEKAYLNLKAIITKMTERVFADSYRMAVAGDGNFRKDIYPEYKANRHADPKKRNRFVPILRKMIVAEGFATAAHGMEADDLLRMWAAELAAEDIDHTVVSIDKDLLMIPGTHYRIHKDEIVIMDEISSMRFYHEQLLQGDPTDNIKGVPKVGPIKAQKYLEGCTDEQSMREIVLQIYYSYFSGVWREKQASIAACVTEEELGLVLYGTASPVSESWKFSKDQLVACNTEQAFSETLEQQFGIKTPRELWRAELMLTGQLIYLKKHKDDWFNLDGWPEASFEDVLVDAPKKTKKAKKMEPWTIATALSAIDPGNVIGTKAWESAMLFLVEESGVDLPEDAITAVEVLSNRNGIPRAEVDAYSVIRRAFSATPLVPLSFNKVVEAPAVAATPPATPFTFKLPTLFSPELSPQAATDTPSLTLPPAVKTASVLAADTKFPGAPVTVIVEKPSIAPPVVSIPTFNPSWGKK
jgi:hypothetical protein